MSNFRCSLLLAVALLASISLSGSTAKANPFKRIRSNALRAIVDGKNVEVSRVAESAAATESSTALEITTKEGSKPAVTRSVEDQDSAEILKNANSLGSVVVPVVSEKEGSPVVTEVQTVASQMWETKVEKNIGDHRSEVASVTTAIKEVESAAKEVLLNPYDEEIRKKLASNYRYTLDELIAAYDKASNGELRTHLASQYGTTLSESKAWYGRDDNYRPGIYKMIHDSAGSCVGIADAGADRPFASGVLIGDNLVLTCAHQVTDRTTANLRVWFNYQQNGGEGVERCTVTRKVAFEEAPAPDLSPLDFCLLEIQRATTSPQRKPFPLLGANVRRGVPIYLIGHPARSPQIVHDNAWILFPFEASRADMKELRIAINAEFVGTGARAAIATNHFMQSYEEVEKGGEKVYRYFGSWGGQRLPLIGAECDTFKGNSGSPAILRETGAVIGILVAGQPAQGEFGSNLSRTVDGYRGGWGYHERILPITYIVQTLDEKMPDWRELYKPTIIND